MGAQPWIEVKHALQTASSAQSTELPTELSCIFSYAIPFWAVRILISYAALSNIAPS
jgi:hypothetical protein